MSAAGICEWCGRKGRFYPAEPDGYVARAEWAEKKMLTHHQEQCECGRWSIWRKGAAGLVGDSE